MGGDITEKYWNRAFACKVLVILSSPIERRHALTIADVITSTSDSKAVHLSITRYAAHITQDKLIHSRISNQKCIDLLQGQIAPTVTREWQSGGVSVHSKPWPGEKVNVSMDQRVDGMDQTYRGGVRVTAGEPERGMRDGGGRRKRCDWNSDRGALRIYMILC